jgi:hypothetical protein
MIVHPNHAVPRCSATVVLLSKIMRPYLFSVKVEGLPPHQHTRTYNVRANSDDSAAFKGIERFVKEFTTAQPIIDMPTMAPDAKLI